MKRLVQVEPDASAKYGGRRSWREKANRLATRSHVAVARRFSLSGGVAEWLIAPD